MAWDCAPIGLLQVLALVRRFGVVGCVVLDRKRPMVCRPCDVYACEFRAFGEAASAGEEVNCDHVSKPSGEGKGGPFPGGLSGQSSFGSKMVITGSAESPGPIKAFSCTSCGVTPLPPRRATLR